MSTNLATLPTQTIRYDAACRALAEAKAVDDVQEIRSRADAIRIYGIQSKNKTLEIDAAEIRIRAERRLGELLSLQKADEGLNKGGNPELPTGRKSRPVVPALSDVGISKDLSARAQKLAAVPKEEFEAEVKDWRGRVESENARVTTRLQAAGERAQAADPMDKAREYAKKQNAKLRALTAELAERDATIAAMKDELHESRHIARELAHDLESYMTVSEGEKAIAKELSALKAQMGVIEGARDQFMNKCNVLVKEVKALQRKLGLRQ